MRTAILIGLGASALLVSACVPPGVESHAHARLKPVARLTCPHDQGRLNLANAATDGRSCDYAGPDGAQIHLSLLEVAGEPDAALSKVETDLKALVPPPPPKPPTPPEPPSPPAPPYDKHNDVHIDLPGVSIHAGDQNAKIRVAGISIDADDRSNSVHMEGGHMPFHHGQFTVDANDNGAIIRTRRVGPDISETLILAADQPGPEGWRAVGYQARGPRSGPLVLAVVKMKGDDHDGHDQMFDDVQSLVKKSAGG